MCRERRERRARTLRWRKERRQSLGVRIIVCSSWNKSSGLGGEKERQGDEGTRRRRRCARLPSAALRNNSTSDTKKPLTGQRKSSLPSLLLQYNFRRKHCLVMTFLISGRRVSFREESASLPSFLSHSHPGPYDLLLLPFTHFLVCFSPPSAPI